MLFNSTEFLFVFLPVTLTGFYLLGTVSRTRRSVGLFSRHSYFMRGGDRLTS